MLLLEKSLIGTYCYMLQDFGKGLGLFLCYGRIKANRAAKELNVTNIGTKEGSLNCLIGLLLFFNGQNNHHLGTAINFNYVSPLSPLHFLKYELECVTLFFCEYYQS